MVSQTDGEVGTVQERHEQMIEEFRKQERARDLLRELERRLDPKRDDGSGLEDHLTELERLAGSFREPRMARRLIESAVGSARAREASKSGSDVSRSRSAIEGRISTLRGVLSRESSGG